MRALATFLLLLAAAPAAAADDTDCTAPTGIGTRACTFPEGQVLIETNLFDGTIDHAGPLRTTSVLAGDTIVHVGVSASVEAQIGWTPFDYERTRNLRNGETMRSVGIGDVALGGKVELLSPQDHAIGISLQPALIVPVGNLKLGSSGVGGDIVLPLSYDLSERLTLDVAPEIQWTGDRDDRGRHLAYGTVIGLDRAIGTRLTATAEYRIERDDDPAFRRTKHVLAGSVGLTPAQRWQISAGIAAGLNARSPKAELIVGFARHFL